MNIQRFTGATAREALGKARMAFGDGTLILSNRPSGGGVEVMATGEDSLSALDQREPPAGAARARPGQRPATDAPVAATAGAQQRVEEDAEQLAMSTLSFQDYVRERMLRRRQSETPARSDEAVARRPAEGGAPRSHAASAPAPALAPAPAPAPAPALAPALAPAKAAPRPAPGAIGERTIVEELHAMRDLIEDRFNTFAWLGEAKQHPIQSSLMLKLMRAGYSPMLSRTILERMSDALSASHAMQWMLETIQRNLKTDPRPLHEDGGSFALVGATGVGKTTTVAKLAGLCAQAHGAASVGLITLDMNRVGAHEQLREHGRSLGIVAHLAHDRAALQDLLGLLMNKRMVLIDTSGLAPRDPRRDDALELLDVPGVTRLLVLDAGAHGDTLDQVVAGFRSGGVQQAVLSKIDEAAKLGPALDVAIRHQLLLRGVTNGQQVPQDWAAADAARLVGESMRGNGKSAFEPKLADLGFFFIQPDHRSGTAGRVDA